MRHETSPTSPHQCIQKDQLFSKLAKYSKSQRHAAQVLPDYREFRLGQGDPLMKASMKYSMDILHRHRRPSQPKTPPTSFVKEEEKEAHLIEQGSPLCGYGINDVVHVDKDTVLTFPCSFNLADEKQTEPEEAIEEDQEDEEEKAKIVNEMDHLQEPRSAAVESMPILQTTPQQHIQKDQVFSRLAKYARSPHATQLLPKYSEFRQGHGDPLMKAAMKNWTHMFHLHPRPKEEEVCEEKEIHLIEQGSPFCGFGINDIVHIDKDTVITFPCSLVNQPDDEPEHVNEIDHLQEHGSSVGGIGLHDIVHIDKDTVLSIPVLPVE